MSNHYSLYLMNSLNWNNLLFPLLLRYFFNQLTIVIVNTFFKLSSIFTINFYFGTREILVLYNILFWALGHDTHEYHNGVPFGFHCHLSGLEPASGGACGFEAGGFEGGLSKAARVWTIIIFLSLSLSSFSLYIYLYIN